MTEPKELQSVEPLFSNNTDIDHCGEKKYFYRIRFRDHGQEYTALSTEPDLRHGDIVITQGEHCPEPVTVISRTAGVTEPNIKRGFSYKILRRADGEEKKKYEYLPVLEKQAASFCRQCIKKHSLSMHLVRAERFFNGSKVIFYFTAENRVDFRELVKDLVQEFRTRVEMRQIGVRHETKMTGGIGACGRELCCTSFLQKFDSVSIKMAKTQDLPLNPAKISGVCNRLLCCLTYEFDNYKTIKREMPRVGRLLDYEGAVYRVVRIFALQGTVLAVSREAGELLMTEEQWQAAKPVSRPVPKKGNKAKVGKKTGQRKKGKKDETSD
ncbi:Cell fate regulator YaaT, PSP1 superfamily (controls sporulation, competence, biofilm development) [Candidatus Electrothrix aarhusensis]|uniref:Cell fate regulator YaaT, PSP1 superfamily (Controls sporulation, competence, biofilm development) n=1 Tax=Candidatus Electrothrix aarhusensis TaxID=1859131 RepID=A0A3S3RS32_9BACT|nr:Cell fate regulator YaaT, PSP1 superfamily (controls sporulation, competence, biofilm development) [Candidatus Electrothrix aarhusensis]